MEGHIIPKIFIDYFNMKVFPRIPPVNFQNMSLKTQTYLACLSNPGKSQGKMLLFQIIHHIRFF